MDCRHVLLLLRHFKFLVLSTVIYNTILAESEVHVESLLFALPGVAFGMAVYLLVSIKDLPDCLLLRYFQFVFGVAEGVDYADWL